MQSLLSVDSLPWQPFSVENSSGYEFKFGIVGAEYTDAYSVDLVRVAPGGRSPLHIDPDNHAFYVVCGTGVVTIAGDAHPVRPGSVVKIPFGALHSIENTGTGHLIFLTLYDPPRRRG